MPKPAQYCVMQDKSATVHDGEQQVTYCNTVDCAEALAVEQSAETGAPWLVLVVIRRIEAEDAGATPDLETYNGVRAGGDFPGTL